jgi:hypothetical protein
MNGFTVGLTQRWIVVTDERGGARTVAEWVPAYDVDTDPAA